MLTFSPRMPRTRPARTICPAVFTLLTIDGATTMGLPTTQAKITAPTISTSRVTTRRTSQAGKNCKNPKDT